MPTLELNGKPFAEQTGTGEPVLKGNINFEGPIRINNQEVLSANGSIRLTVDEISEKTQGGGITLSHSLKNSSGAEIINSSGSIGSAVDFTNIANNAISGDKIYGGTISTSAAVFEGSSANAIVRITQTGSGNALVVEDSANPDSTPFVVDSTGRVIVGHTSNVVAPGASSPALQLHGLNVALSTTAITNWANNAFSTPILSLNKSKSGVIETLGSVSSGDWLGVLQFTGDDGTSFISAASIVAQLDGTPGTNDMPGRLVFSTTADGSSSPTEAMRIDSNQSVQIKNNSSSDALRITQTGSGNALVVEDSANPDSTPFVVSSNGNVGIGKEPTTKLEIYNAGYAAAQITGDSTSETQLVFDDNTAARINNRSNTPLIFATNATERMRIDSSGDVGIGVTPTGAAKLEVQSTLQITDSQSPLLKLRDVGNSTSYIGASGIGLNNAGLDNIYMAGYNAVANSTYDLRIIGSSGNIDTRADMHVDGALSKSSGSFRIDHPIKQNTHHLVHSFVEAPQADNIYRGKVALVNGIATVNIDTVAGMTEGTFAALNREVQCFTTNESGWTAIKGSVTENIITIEAQDNTCTDTISWIVIGERQDQHMYDTEWTDENGKVIVEPEKPLENLAAQEEDLNIAS